MAEVVAGVFVGGQSRRMHGIPKGLLQPPDRAEVLVTHLVRQLAQADCHDVVLVGDNAAYAHLGLTCVADAAPGRGPIAGLLGLARYASSRGIRFVLALACDMPNVDRVLLRRLIVEAPSAAALVPKRQYWEPLCARYLAQAVLAPLELLLGTDHPRMMDLMAALGPGCVAIQLEPRESELLTDWDSPSDLPEGVTYRGVALNRSGKTP